MWVQREKIEERGKMIKEESLSDKLTNEKIKSSLVKMEESGMIKCEDGNYSISKVLLAMMRERGLSDTEIKFWNTENGIINLAKWWTIIREK